MRKIRKINILNMRGKDLVREMNHSDRIIYHAMMRKKRLCPKTMKGGRYK